MFIRVDFRPWYRPGIHKALKSLLIRACGHGGLYLICFPVWESGRATTGGCPYIMPSPIPYPIIPRYSLLSWDAVHADRMGRAVKFGQVAPGAAGGDTAVYGQGLTRHKARIITGQP